MYRYPLQARDRARLGPRHYPAPWRCPVRRTARTLAGVAGILALAWVAARAQQAPSDTAEPLSVALPPVDIVAPSPLLGRGPTVRRLRSEVSAVCGSLSDDGTKCRAAKLSAWKADIWCADFLAIYVPWPGMQKGAWTDV